MNEEKSDNCSIEGTSAKALRQEESCRHFRQRNMQMWPKNREGEEENLEMKIGPVTYRTKSEFSLQLEL